MKGVTEVKGLHDVRTFISTHSRSASRHKGTPYLEILALGMEKLRLGTELARLSERVARVEARLSEIGPVLEDRLNTVAEEAPPDSSAHAGAASEKRPSRGNPTGTRGWKTMTVGY